MIVALDRAARLARTALALLDEEDVEGARATVKALHDLIGGRQ
jgi:hypothetical protein